MPHLTTSKSPVAGRNSLQMQHLISARTRAQSVDKTAATLGATLPAEYLEQVARAHTFADKVAQIAATADDLLGAVFTAIGEGRDYHGDSTVQRLALDHQLASLNLGRTTERRLNDMLTAALTDCADEILDDWADALEPHSAALVDAAQAGLSLTNLDARNVDTMRQQHGAQVAVKAWADAVNGFHALAAVSGVRIAGDTSALALTPARRADLKPAMEVARDAQTDVDAWTLARCGLPLELPTLGDYMARSAIYEADRQAEERAYAERAEAAGFDR
jgi:hypothetical protein